MQENNKQRNPKKLSLKRIVTTTALLGALGFVTVSPDKYSQFVRKNTGKFVSITAEMAGKFGGWLEQTVADYNSKDRFLNSPSGKELKRKLGRNFNSSFFKSYEDFLKREKSLSLAEELKKKKNFSNRDVSHYSYLLDKEVNLESIVESPFREKRLGAVVKAMKTSKEPVRHWEFANAINSTYDPKYSQGYETLLDAPRSEELLSALGNEFQNEQIENYVFLLERGFKTATIKRLAPKWLEAQVQHVKYLDSDSNYKAFTQSLGKPFNLKHVKRCKDFSAVPGHDEFASVRGDQFNLHNTGNYASFLRKIPQALELTKTLGERFHDKDISSYIKLWERGDFTVEEIGKNDLSSEVLSKVVGYMAKSKHPKKHWKLAHILGEKYSTIRNEWRKKIVENPRGLELVEHLKAAKDDFPSYNLEEYLELLNEGLEPKAIAGIPDMLMGDLLKYLKKKIIPKEVIPYFVHSRAEHCVKMAGKDPDLMGGECLGADAEKVRGYIKKKLALKEFCFREGADYGESLAELDHIKNINMIYLVKGYVDFLQKEENVAEVFRLMEDDIKKNPYSEEGGVMAYTEKGYMMVRINIRDDKKRTPNMEDNESFSLPQWFRWIGGGQWHFHATREQDTKYSGPSGSATYDGPLGNGDIGVLRSYNKNKIFGSNPYEVNIVFTKLEGDKFNADVYCRDVGFGPMNQMVNYGPARVFDIGVYEKSKKKSSTSPVIKKAPQPAGK